MLARVFRSTVARPAFFARAFGTKRFTESHEWFMLDKDDIYKVGISKHARENLGEVVYASEPEVGTKVQVGETFLDLESIKAVAPVYSPIDGEIAEVNNLGEGYSKLNEDPEGEGWLIKVKTNGKLPTGLSAEEYTTMYPDA